MSFLKKQLILLYLLLCTAGISFAQSGFDKIYDFWDIPGHIGSSVRSVYADSQKIFVLGLTYRDTVFTDGYSNLASFIGAVDYSGNLIWRKKMVFSNSMYHATEPNFFHLIGKIGSDRYVLGSQGWDIYNVPGFAISRPFLYFFKSNGDSIRFVPMPFGNNTNENYFYSLLVDRNKNVLAAGTYWNKAMMDTAGIWLAKFDSIGNFKWRKVILDTPFYYTGAEGFKIINSNTNTGYLVGGYSLDPDTTHKTQYCFWRVDTAGNVLWRRNIPKTSDWMSDFVYSGTSFFDIINAKNGSGYYFMATAPKPLQFPNEPLSYREVYFCGKIDEEGQVVWAKTYERDTLHHEEGTGLVQKENGDLLFMGTSSGFYTQTNTGGTTLFSTDSSGHVKWFRNTRRYECPYDIGYLMYSMKLTPQGGIVRGGYIGQFNPQPGCYDTADAISWLVLTDSLGRRNPTDTVTFPLQSDPVIFPIDTTVSIKLIPDEELPQLKLYPNPATDKVYIELTNFKGKATDVSFQLYDSKGSLLLQNKLNATKQSLDISGYSPGLYLIKLRYKDRDIGAQKITKQ